MELIPNLTLAIEYAMTGKLPELKNLIDEIATELNPDRIQLNWHVTDVLSQVPRLTPEEALEVLQTAKSNHDACYGICWDTFDTIADQLFPPPNRIDALPKVKLTGFFTASPETSCTLEAAIGEGPEAGEMTYSEAVSDNLIHYYFATSEELDALELPNSRLISGFTITGWELKS